MEQKKNKKKRKLTWNKVGLILLVALLAANFYVWKAKTASETQLAALKGDIGSVEQQIKEMPEPADDLESRLEKIKTGLAAVQEGFPATVDRNEVIDYLLKVAVECNVQILPLVSEGWMTQEIGQSYNVLSMTAAAEGSLTNVKRLITTLTNGQYPTLTISDFVVERTGDQDISVTEDEMQVRIGLRIGIFTFSPEPGEEAAI